MTTTMTGIDARGEFRELFKIIAEKLSADEAYVTHQNICDHFVSVGAISAGDGSQYDFIRAMDHYNKLLMAAKPKPLLAQSGRFYEEEFVKFWFNCHSFYNSYDTTNSGGVTEAEFIEKMNELNPSIDQTDQIKEMFKRIDRNSDNEITFIEFFTRLPQIMECL